MPLRSRLFADNQQLQDCLVRDSAHVVPGARGDHVALIQSALVRLRALEPGDACTEARTYGPKTAAAVLRYKSELGIINGSYQNQADDIVGKRTIASLDEAIRVLDGAPGVHRVPAPSGHPQSPPVVPPASASAGSQSAPIGAGAPVQVGAGTDAFGPPLCNLPPDVQDAIRRTNDAKKPDQLLLYPFVGKDEGPLSAAELSKRFEKWPNATQILRDLHARMRPFDIWKNIRIIVNVWVGTGASGLFCEPFDHNAFLAQMQTLTTGPHTSFGPDVLPTQNLLVDAKFCRDRFNVHGPRDSFREMVKQGPGLHICITEPAARATEPCDLHIDHIQQGSVCSASGGWCIPIVNGQTIEHVKTVGPWLKEQAWRQVEQLKRYIPKL